MGIVLLYLTQDQEEREHHILEAQVGGAVNLNAYGGNLTGNSGQANGGQGGNGIGYRQSTSWYNRRAGGGAGNPGGYGGITLSGQNTGNGNTTDGQGENGTGGLLVIYCDKILNNGKIESNGSKGGSYAESTGGSSGGGSINIFYNNKIEQNGTVSAQGGEKVDYGANGGNGSISIGCIKTGNYVTDTEELIFKKDKVELIDVLNNDIVLGNNGKRQDDVLEFDNLKGRRRSTANYVWTSSDESVVTVDNNGILHFVNNGNATITCTVTTRLGDTKTASFDVNASRRMYIYYYGNKFTSITGGYTDSRRGSERFYPYYDDNRENMYIDCHANRGGGGIYTANKLDMTDYLYVKAYGNVDSWAESDSGGRIFAITTTNAWGTVALPSSYVAVSNTGMTYDYNILTCDVSALTDSYYVTNGFNQSRGYIYEVWLER